MLMRVCSTAVSTWWCWLYSVGLLASHKALELTVVLSFFALQGHTHQPNCLDADCPI